MICANKLRGIYIIILNLLSKLQLLNHRLQQHKGISSFEHTVFITALPKVIINSASLQTFPNFPHMFTRIESHHHSGSGLSNMIFIFFHFQGQELCLPFACPKDKQDHREPLKRQHRFVWNRDLFSKERHLV